MLRFFFKALIVVLIIGIILAAFIWDRRVRYISNFLSNIMPTKTIIKDLRISGNQFIIKGLHIANPEGSKLDTAFASEVIRITTEPRNLLSKDLVIDEIAIDDPLVGIEFYSADGSQNNWSLILNKLNLAASKQNTSHRTYLIKKLIMTKVKLHVVNSALNTEPFDPEPLPKIEFHNIGSDKPLTLQLIVATIFRAMLQETAKRESLKAILKGVKPLPVKIEIEKIPSQLEEKKTELIKELFLLPEAKETP